MLNNVTVFSILTYASVNSTCAQPPPPPSRPGYCGAFARLVRPGGGAFANFALPGGRAFASPGAIPELLTRRQFPNEIGAVDVNQRFLVQLNQISVDII